MGMFFHDGLNEETALRSTTPLPPPPSPLSLSLTIHISKLHSTTPLPPLSCKKLDTVSVLDAHNMQTSVLGNYVYANVRRKHYSFCLQELEAESKEINFPT